MQDTLIMRMLDRIRQPRHELSRLRSVVRALILDPLGQRLARNIFHGEVVLSFALSRFVNGDDMGMPQGSHSPRF